MTPLFPARLASALSLLAVFLFSSLGCVTEQPEQCQVFLDCAESSSAYSDEDKALFEKHYGKEGDCWGDWDLAAFCEERCLDFNEDCQSPEEASEGEGEGEGEGEDEGEGEGEGEGQ